MNRHLILSLSINKEMAAAAAIVSFTLMVRINR